MSLFQVRFRSTRLLPSFTVQSHLPQPPGSRSHFQSYHRYRAETSETTVLEWWAARQAEEIDRPPRCGEARAAVPPSLHACATPVPRSASLVGWARLTNSRIRNQGAKLGAKATKRFLELSWNNTRPSIPKALETLCACGDWCFGAHDSGGKEPKPCSSQPMAGCVRSREERPPNRDSLRLCFTPC